MDEATVYCFDRDAAAIATAYEQSSMEEVQRQLVRYLPGGGRVLEIGCGSGRDAAFLTKEGFSVTAVDPSAGMIGEAVARHPVLEGRVLQEGFPLSPESPLLEEKYQAVVSIATVMHIPDSELFEFALQVRELLEPGGVLVISSSVGREGLRGNRDPSGRLMLERPPDELQLLFERTGFRYITGIETADAAGRNLRWHTLVMERSRGALSRPIDEIETIISRDRKNTTYKLALLRALCDVALHEQSSATWRADGLVSVPMGLVLEKWLFYFWPVIEADLPDGTVAVPQMRGGEKNGKIVFRQAMRELVSRYHHLGGVSAMYHDYRSGTVPADLHSYLEGALRGIETAIIRGPVKYAGGAIKGADSYFSYEKGKAGKKDYRSAAAALYTKGSILVPAGAWREMCLIGHWISESLVLRWAELTCSMSGGLVPVERAVGLLLSRPDMKREVSVARAAYGQVPGLECTWTGRKLGRSFEIDHVIPFAVSHNNDLWNLAPAEKSINSKKSDKLVTAKTLVSSKGRIIDNWEVLHDSAPERFELEVRRSLLHRGADSTGWLESAFSGLREKVETIAILRGVPRWDAP